MNLIRSLWGITLLLLALGQLQAAGKPVEKNKAKLDTLRSQISRLSNDLAQDRGQLSNYQRELRDIERNIARHAFTLKDLDRNLKRRKGMVAKLEKQQQSQQHRLRQHRQLLARQLQAAYLMGRQDRLKLLLSQQDPSRVVRLLKYHEYLNQARSRQVKQLGALVANLADTRHELDSEKQRVASLRKQANQRQQGLEQSKRERAALLKRLTGKIRDKDKALSSLKQDEADLKRLIAKLQRAMAELAEQHKVRFRQRKGRMHWPVKGRISARFNSPRSGGMRRDGVFIRAAEGSEVKAVHQGRVAFADWLRGYGLLMIIDHGRGYMSLYGHNQTLFKGVGDRIRPGESIAQSGAGSQNISGIYFGIRHQGKPLDPARWCK